MHIRRAAVNLSAPPAALTRMSNKLFHQWQQITEALSDLLIRHDTCQSRMTRRLPRRCCCLTFEVESQKHPRTTCCVTLLFPENWAHEGELLIILARGYKSQFSPRKWWWNELHCKLWFTTSLFKIHLQFKGLPFEMGGKKKQHEQEVVAKLLMYIFVWFLFFLPSSWAEAPPDVCRICLVEM